MPLTENSIQQDLDALQAQRDDVPGFAIAVVDKGKLLTAASGAADPDGTPMTVETPFRLASVTKTFVAAALLRLSEQGKLDLDTPITNLISDEHVQLLEADGYMPQSITVRHLMMHAGGLDDHFGSEAGIAAALADPQRQWTRTEQLALMVELTDPVGKAGERFHYSDTGYILLGEIIEKLTGEPLSRAVRDLNRFEALGMDQLRWETIQGVEQGATRAHQWIDGLDIFAINGSLDAFGGGGLIGNVVDTATYFDALFGGQIFASPETLKLMLEAPSHPEDSPYRLGLFVEQIGGHTVYMHGGFWGVNAMHVPSLDLTIAYVALDQSGDADMKKLAFDLIRAR
ncbi:MAG: serine hydrolase domain-containing protein [Pseudomonadota bacterium]